VTAPRDDRRPPGEEPVERHLRVNDVDLCVFEWPGDGPPLLFSHATGFHARCWDEVIRRLPGRRAIAVDMRGHGRSEKPAAVPYDWRHFGDDVTALVGALDLTRTVAIGHSMGGHSVTYAAGREPERFGALLLVDPVIRTPEGYREAASALAREDASDSSFVARRRNEWASPEEMIERFAGRPPFNRWDPRVLDDYCRYGLLPAAGGEGFVLACPPAVEAAIYAHAARTDVYDVIPNIRVPVRVLRAPAAPPGAAPFTGSPTAPDLAAHFARGEDVLLEASTHFIPMESPALVAGHVAEIAGRVAGA
jgi:pimeloyl-ACP methyl ester carboxylesterase